MSRAPFVSDPDFTLYIGDALEVLRDLPDESVHCCVTSPPFYALRDYGVEGQIGLETSPEEWCSRLVAVFSEVRRVLRSDGTLWVECGDSYHGGGANATGLSNIGRAGTARGGRGKADARRSIENVKPKDLLLQPFLLAMALRADGWWLRQVIVWHKPNAMPESATDRCTTAHSYVFLLSKLARYHFDAEAIAEPAEWARWGDQTVPKYEGTTTTTGWIQPRSKDELRDRFVNRSPNQKRSDNGIETRSEGRTGGRADRANGQKNPRSVWTIPTQGYPDAHFATWPEALVDRILKAGCPEDGTCLDPFMGSGTTALVARKLGRRSIGIELNKEYARLAADRLKQLSLFAEQPA